MTRRVNVTASLLRSVGFLAVVGILAAGCTTPDPKQSATASSSPSASSSVTAGQDRSAELLGFTPPTSELGSATGKWGPNSSPLTIHVGAVHVGDSSTLLTWWLTAENPNVLLTTGPPSWAGFPTLVDPAGAKAYGVDSFDNPAWDGRMGVLLDAYTSRINGGYQLTALYPRLPDGVNTVEVRMKGFDPITVPVTR